jgi:hypothetical protein
VRIHHPQQVPDAGPRGHEGEHGDDLAVAAQHGRGAAVDRGDRHLDALPEPRLERAYELGDRLAARNRDARGAHHPAAVGVRHDILGQQLLELPQVAGRRGGHEGVEQAPLLARAHLAVTLLGEVLAGAAHELPGGHLRHLHDGGDLGVVVAERLAQDVGLPPHPDLLQHVLRLGDAAEHPVGHAEQSRTGRLVDGQCIGQLGVGHDIPLRRCSGHTGPSRETGRRAWL